MSAFENGYKYLLRHIIVNGSNKNARNGNTRSCFNLSLLADLRQGFPILTGRKVFYRGVFGEMAAFVRGLDALKDFRKLGCNYWDDNAKAWEANEGLSENEMSIGMYVGALWRHFPTPFSATVGVDQLSVLIEQLRANPESRRHVLSAWHPDAPSCIPPCTVMAIFNVQDGFLNCHVTQRSADWCLGVPSDFIGYAVLTHLLAKEAELKVGSLAFTFVDAHVYEEHVQPAYAYLQKPVHLLPELKIAPDAGVLNFLPSDLHLEGYKCEAPVKFEFKA